MSVITCSNCAKGGFNLSHPVRKVVAAYTSPQHSERTAFRLKASHVCSGSKADARLFPVYVCLSSRTDIALGVLHVCSVPEADIPPIGIHLSQLVKHGLCIDEIASVEALAKPAINWCEDVARLSIATTDYVKRGNAECGSQCMCFRFLFLS